MTPVWDARPRCRLADPIAEFPAEPDLARMRRARVAKVQAAMQAAGVETLVCCGQANVSYVTGAKVPAADHARARRRGARSRCSAPTPPRPNCSPRSRKAPPEGTKLQPWCAVETDTGAQELVAVLPRGPIAIDDMPVPLWTALGGRELRDAAAVLGPAKLTKTADELACIAGAQAINERAMERIRPPRAGGRGDGGVGGVPRGGCRAGCDRQHGRPGVPGDAEVDRR